MERLDGVVHADVSFEEKTATVQYDPHQVTPEQMIAAIKGIGFRTRQQAFPADTRYQGQGTVVAVDLQRGTVTVDHGELPGLMPPMVMEFVVEAQEALNGLQPGARIRFTLRPRGVTFTIADMTVMAQ